MSLPANSVFAFADSYANSTDFSTLSAPRAERDPSFGDWGEVPEVDPLGELLALSDAERQQLLEEAAYRPVLSWADCVCILQHIPPTPLGQHLAPTPVFSEFAPTVDWLRQSVKHAQMPMPCTPSYLVEWAKSVAPSVALPERFERAVAPRAASPLLPKGPSDAPAPGAARRRKGRPTEEAAHGAIFEDALRLRAKNCNMTRVEEAKTLSKLPSYAHLSASRIRRIVSEQASLQAKRAGAVPQRLR